MAKVNKKVNKQQIRQIRNMAKKDIPGLIDKLFDLLETGIDMFAEEQAKSGFQKEGEEHKKEQEDEQKDKKD